MPDLEIRLATLADAKAIGDIYNTAVDTTSTFDLRPRSLEEQEAWLRDRAGAYAAIVAVDLDGGPVVGFASLSSYRHRPAYSTTVEDSIYVHSDQQGRGIGGRLLAELLSIAIAHGFHSVIARIVGGNEASISLHARAGFEHVGVEREVGRKHRQWLDVVEMQKLFDGPHVAAAAAGGGMDIA